MLVDETMRRGAVVDNGDGYELTSNTTKVEITSLNLNFSWNLVWHNMLKVFGLKEECLTMVEMD